MTNFPKNCKSAVIPTLRYRNAKTMIDWLFIAFGFEKQAVYLGPNDNLMPAQLAFGNGMIMIGSVGNDGLYANAKVTGAIMIADIEAKEYGGKAFSCSDPEGHICFLGSYDPWENPQPRS